ncbi:leukocyte elastase inhibitor-like [Eublepharis macularius]|uniref:Leukocyte elastase inhibitor-like n=1 Tax=Eublepharis macularius TaxID=481883 RepID=A0AA97L3G8_EUBMA|nr:leukocyte elastase inhibitor-like [Eublepharis macularius]
MDFTKESLSKAITAFGLDLYNELNRSDTPENIFYSPLSISCALSMVFLGTRGNTKTQMGQVLHFDKTASEKRLPAVVSEHQRESDLHCLVEGGINLQFKNILSQLNNLRDGYLLTLANNLFAQKGYDFFQEYLKGVKEIYGTTLQTVDFYNSTEDARQTINAVIDKQTQGKIKELFAPGIIEPQTVLVLTNAIYFKATWEHQFDPKFTKESDFWLNKNESKSVHMMHQRGKFKLGHVAEMNAQILCLPYFRQVLSMIILLPNDISDLKKVEQAMSRENLARWTASENMEERYVEMYIPRFKLEQTFNLKSALQNLGMVDVFDRSKADLTGMSPSRQLFLSKVIHKAYVEVNEVGTEAAAATGAVVSNRSLVDCEQFVADHPFLFYIQHNPTNTTLFLGKFCSP